MKKSINFNIIDSISNHFQYSSPIHSIEWKDMFRVNISLLVILVKMMSVERKLMYFGEITKILDGKLHF